MSEKRFEFYSDEFMIGVLDTVTGRTFDSLAIVDCLNELFEHNLYLQRLIESLAKVTGESIEDTIERYTNNK